MAEFRYRLRVRYAECDAQGIAFNARWGDWVDLATTELLRAIFGDPGAMDYRLVQQRTTWVKPGRFDDVVELAPTVVRVGTTSFEVETEGTVLGETHLTAVTTYVRVVDGVKAPLGALGERLLAGAPGRVVDHAMSGLGRVVDVVRLADATPVPWRNGGGVTRELWCEGEGPCGFGVRLSVAEVDADGPFSTFQGVDRVIAQLSGGGFALAREAATGSQRAQTAEGSRSPEVEVQVTGRGPWAFAGEDRWDCRLLDGPVRDFNAMVDRSRWTVAVVPREPGWVDARFAVALEPGRIGGLEVQVGDLAVCEGAVYAEVPVYAVFLHPRA